MPAPHESRAPRTPDHVRDALAGIAALLAPAHPSVTEEVLHAHDRPHDYVPSCTPAAAATGRSARRWPSSTSSQTATRWWGCRRPAPRS